MRRRLLRSLQSKCVRVEIIQVSQLGFFDLHDRAWVEEVAALLHGRAHRLAFAFQNDAFDPMEVMKSK